MTDLHPINVSFRGKVYRLVTEDDAFLLGYWIAICDAWEAA